ncbi:MAG TPA: SDR family NAD(P)-dependent oxidoreductase [Pseudonocardia sp.]|jgi:NAD(P)-dependent dehydrogenase (short-subunit alcohol dehydrogenase family)|nr:SDR family NAD(P)-dependent oxidoreductase [Pseudonocardia sp.]
MDFTGRRALVTGAASGIGREVATALVSAGAAVMVTDLDAEGAARTAADIGAHGYGLDVAEPDQFSAAVDHTTAELGGLDTVVNAAGLELRGSLVKMSHEDFNRSIAVNLTGTFNAIKYTAPALIAAGGGSIVCIASVAALGGGLGIGAYCASKAGVLQLVRTGALELRSQGVRVNAVLPGFVQTPMVEKVRPRFERLIGMPLDDFVTEKQGRWGQPEDVAKAILFLASDDAGFITGSSCVVDGGLSVAAI